MLKTKLVFLCLVFLIHSNLFSGENSSLLNQNSSSYEALEDFDEVLLDQNNSTLLPWREFDKSKMACLAKSGNVKLNSEHSQNVGLGSIYASGVASVGSVPAMALTGAFTILSTAAVLTIAFCPIVFFPVAGGGGYYTYKYKKGQHRQERMHQILFAPEFQNEKILEIYLHNFDKEKNISILYKSFFNELMKTDSEMCYPNGTLKPWKDSLQIFSPQTNTSSSLELSHTEKNIELLSKNYLEVKKRCLNLEKLIKNSKINQRDARKLNKDELLEKSNIEKSLYLELLELIKTWTRSEGQKISMENRTHFSAVLATYPEITTKRKISKIKSKLTRKSN